MQKWADENLPRYLGYEIARRNDGQGEPKSAVGIAQDKLDER